MTSDDPPEPPEPEAGSVPEADVRGDQDVRGDRGDRGNMLPPRRGRRFALERVFVRLVATTGIIGIGVGLGAVLADNKVQGWIIGLVVALVSVILAGILWSSRQL